MIHGRAFFQLAVFIVRKPLLPWKFELDPINRFRHPRFDLDKKEYLMFKSMSRLASFITIVCLTIPVSATSGKTVWYVDDSSVGGLNNGTSWENAFIELQSALDVASYSDEIRVAQGTYTPDYDVTSNVHNGDRTASFSIYSEVELYGGYAGYGAADPDLRDVTNHVTILSGDLAGNDGPGFLNNNENSYHVVHTEYVYSGTIIDGFTVTGANGNGETFPDYYGGGMFNYQSSPSVTNCIFDSNIAVFGGGMSNYKNSSPIIDNCHFSGNTNTIENGSGGGMYNAFGSNPELSNCTFAGNSATGIYGNGGGMFNAESSPTLVNCTFRDNTATQLSGGIHNVADSNPDLATCSFTNNSASIMGGGLYNASSNPTLTNCTFSSNSAFLGGGLSNYYSNPVITNCTFSSNTATRQGAGILAYENSYPTITNCILWGNVDSNGVGESSQIRNIGTNGVLSVSHSCIQGLATYSGSGNIGNNPLFVDFDGLDDIPGTEDDDLRLQAGSPCINGGDNTAIPVGITTDIDGLPRVHACVVDMGAYEYQGYVPSTVFGDSDLDCFITLDDYQDFHSCIEQTGSKLGTRFDNCTEVFDSDGDDDVDLADFAVFQAAFGSRT